MLELFLRCVSAKDKYIHSDGAGGDYYIETERDTLYILFEGSDGAEDWISNFDFFPSGERPLRRIISVIKSNIQPACVAYKDAPSVWRVHRGFLRVWKDMRDEIEADVDKRLKADASIDSIVIVGYSHGGALALLAYEDMKYIYGDKYAINGFGFAAPRVIFGRVPREVQERISGFVTVRNGNDIVTHLPPRLFGYKNSGDILNIGRKHIYTPIGAHYPFAYFEELKEWVLKRDPQKRIYNTYGSWRLERNNKALR